MDIGALRVNGYVTLYVAHSFMAIMWRGYYAAGMHLKMRLTKARVDLSV